jgi:tetratricopeptide (TPR) repeat protein
MRSKLLVAVLVAVLAFYLVLLGLKGVQLVRVGSLVGIGLGVGMLLLAVVGAVLVVREVRFGQATGKLTQRLIAEGGLPVDDLPRRPSGRIDRNAADAVFSTYREAVEASPDDWRAWFRLALAYDAAGDRSNARAAARKAIALS